MNRKPRLLKSAKKIKIGEELRMEYRYLDLRDPKMQKNLMKRSEVIAFFK